MTHYKYVNVVRRPDGSLRPWEEYNALSKYEDNCTRIGMPPPSIAIIHYARTIKEIEDEERSRFQSTLSKVCNKT